MVSTAPDGAGTWDGPYFRVDDAPFLVVGAEIHNSSSSTIASIRRSFTTVQRLGANTVLAPVAWDQWEPAEGQFGSTLIDAMMTTAHALGLRLIPLWFGSWKNASSTYAPAWVKRDSARFPRAEVSGGRRVEHLSAFSPAGREADARAFAALMRRIRDVDEHRVVIAVQVENEPGLLGDSRDRSPLAQAAFEGDVPTAVIQAVAADPAMPSHQAWMDAGRRTAGTWDEVFVPGDALDEVFMATAVASYTGAVAAAGARQYDVPMFVNAWLDEHSVLEGPVALAGGKRPGEYPSGGPVLTVAPIWEALAPALAFLAPDAYVDDAEHVFAGYAARRGRLMVLELRADMRGIAQMFSAVGTHRALGVSPFGVDALDADSPNATALVDALSLLSAVAALVRQEPDAAMQGFVLDAVNPSTMLRFDDLVLTIEAGGMWGLANPVFPAYGVAIQDGSGVFVVGRGFSVGLVPAGGSQVSFLSADQYDLCDGELTVTLRLNGDETGSGTSVPFPPASVALAPDGPIPVWVPDTGIVRIEAYAY